MNSAVTVRSVVRLAFFSVLGLLASGATVWAQRAGTPSPEIKGQPMPQGFSVVLVLGDVQTTASSADNVPPAARKALADMKDFLPYKSYRLLDAQWILGSRQSTTRLRGPDDQEYELTLRTSSVPMKVGVAFQLHEPGGLEGVRRALEQQAEVKARLAELEGARRVAQEQLVRARERNGEKNPDANAVRAKITDLESHIAVLERPSAAAAAGRTVIDTSFSMDVGETVVVGTSRLRGGDKGLIALLTAVPKASPGKPEE